MSELRIQSARHEQLSEHDYEPPRRATTTPSASQRLDAFISDGPAIQYPAELFATGRGAGGAATTALDPEGAVASRSDLDQPMRLDGPTTQTERLANLKRLTQVDGNRRTSDDRSTCGVQCVVAGLYLQKPASLMRVAAMELAKNGDKLSTWAGCLHISERALRADLQAIASGKASPRQLAVLSQVLMLDLRSRISVPAAGISPREIQTLTQDILMKDCGVEAPSMQLSLRTLPGGNGHWTAEFGIATRADVDESAKEDAVVAYDPWPDASGKAGTSVTLSHEGAAYLHRGSLQQNYRMGSDGTVR